MAKTLILIIIGFAVTVLVVILLIQAPNKPKSKVFKCADCGKAARHNHRTINAWCRGLRDMFCDPCHAVRDSTRRQ
jgi:hypothetical protein